MRTDALAPKFNPTHEQIQEFRDNIRAAFKELRTKGFIARMNYMCCMGCATAAISNEFATKESAKSKIGYAFYHKQDAECIDHGELMIRYGDLGLNSPKTEVIGAMIKSIFLANNLKVEWDGNPEKCIRLHII